MSGYIKPGPDGAKNLRDLGIDYYADTDWEYTLDAGELEHVHDMLNDIGRNESCEVQTFIKGPPLFAIFIPISFDGHGDPDDEEIRFFESDEAARAARAAAIAQGAA